MVFLDRWRVWFIKSYQGSQLRVILGISSRVNDFKAFARWRFLFFLGGGGGINLQIPSTMTNAATLRLSLLSEGQMWCHQASEMSNVDAGRQSDGINAVAPSHAASFSIVTLSTNCQSTETSGGFCFLSWGQWLVCHAKKKNNTNQKKIFPFPQQPLWRCHVAGIAAAWRGCFLSELHLQCDESRD